MLMKVLARMVTRGRLRGLPTKELCQIQKVTLPATTMRMIGRTLLQSQPFVEVSLCSCLPCSSRKYVSPDDAVASAGGGEAVIREMLYR